MLEEITFHPILGIPLIVYGGLFTALLFFLTGLIGFGVRQGMMDVPARWHYYLAYMTLASGFLHAFLGFLAYI